MNVAAPVASSEVTVRRITVAEYNRMIEAGIIREDEKVELLDGQLVTRLPGARPAIGCRHVVPSLLSMRRVCEQCAAGMPWSRPLRWHGTLVPA